MNIYAPNTRQISFLRKALTKARAVCKGRLIICGDFNTVPDIHMDSTSPAKRRESPLRQLLTSHDVFDVWRCHHGSEKDFPYFSPRHNSYSRIDLFLTDKWLLQNISASVIHTVTWSDHAPISISINDTTPQRNTFLWQTNNYILQHPSYSLDIEKHIHEYFDVNKGSEGDPVTVWNAHKAVIRDNIMQLSSMCKMKSTQQIDTLTSQIVTLESQHKTNPEPNVQAQLLTLRRDLRSLLLHSYELIQRRLKASSYSTSNKAGKRLAQRLKGQRIKSKIPTLFYSQSTDTLTNPQDIANAFSDYYSKLYNIKNDHTTYQPSPEDINNFLQQIKLPTLTDSQLSSLNEPFSEREILHTISSLPSGKAPGPDGLTGEYYKKFSRHLLPHLTEFFNIAASSSKFTDESLNALIITIPKPGKAPTSLQNFRPISLLNLDVKIYAKTIARRLMAVMPDLIHTDQSGFIGADKPLMPQGGW